MDTEKNVKIGNYIRCLREQKGWTQEELAYRVGVSSRTIGTWEAGTGSIKTDNIRKLASVLGVNEVSKCAGRYRSFDINVVLESRSDQLSYIDYDGVIDTVDIIPPPEPGKSIIQIAIEYEADKLIVRNMKSGRAFLITKNPLDYFGKYGKVYGYMRNDTGQFSSKSKEIFYANNPAWIVEWFKKD